jgi:hypothetical protein
LNKNLPVISIFLEALRLPYKHFRLLMKLSIPVFVVALGVEATDYFLSIDKGSSFLMALNTALQIVLCLLLSMAVVGCHRIVILGDRVVDETSLLHWTGNEFAYIGWSILIIVCGVVINLFLKSIMEPFMLPTINSYMENEILSLGITFLLSIPMYYLMSRWFLVLPSSAIGVRRKSLYWYWSLSSGNGWRLTVLIGFLPFAIGSLLDRLAEYDSVLFILMYGAICFIFSVIQIGLMSLSYKFLTDNLSEENDSAESRSTVVA